MISIENEILSVSIQPKGAELQSIFHKHWQLEYMWSGDPAYWSKKSPILFPIVGTLKDDTYYVEGQAYKMSRHGFARESDFTVSEQSGSAVCFTLESNEQMFARYPFAFRLDLRYELTGNTLSVSYIVSNRSRGNMLFSVGGHPAFRVPLVPGLAYNDYYLEFNQPENAGRWPISAAGLIETTPTALLNNSRELPLSKELFMNDALVLKGLVSDTVDLRSARDTHGLSFHFPGFPFLGIWAAKQADFVCIEPWCGIADSVDSNQQLAEKEGIQSLPAAGTFKRTWAVTVF